MSTEFDYKRAQRDWAYPRWLKLPEAVKALYVRVQQECCDLKQNKVLGMDWPESGKLKAAFDAVEVDVLAEAATTIYSLGHWDSNDNKDLDFPRDESGCYWKFEHYAKQSCIERGFCNAGSRKWPKIDTADYMSHVEDTDYNDDELAGLLVPMVAPLFEVMGVNNVNHRVTATTHRGHDGKHPFCIGTKHFPKDGGVYINVHQAGCYICGASYEEHVSDKVITLKIVRKDATKLDSEEAANLEALADFMTMYKIDGFVFVE